MSKPVIKAVIFDSDGTIIDSPPMYWKAVHKLAGEVFSREFYLELDGRKDMDIADMIVKRYNMNMTAEEFLAKRDAFVDEQLEHCPLVAGIDTIIKKVHDMGLPMSIATGSQRIPFERKYKNHSEIRSLFKVVITGNDVNKGKPDPTVFLTAMKSMGDFKPENILVFEDAYFGVLAAQNAGMNCVYLHSDETNVEQQFKNFGIKNADYVEKWSDFDFNKYIWDVKQN